MHLGFKAASLLLVAVRSKVVLGRMLSMFCGMDVMTVRQVRVVGSSYVVTALVMPGGFVVMTRSVLMVFRCLLVMMRCFLGHRDFLSLLCCARCTSELCALDVQPKLQSNQREMNICRRGSICGSKLHLEALAFPVAKLPLTPGEEIG